MTSETKAIDWTKPQPLMCVACGHEYTGLRGDECPLHLAAPDLYAACKVALNLIRSGCSPYTGEPFKLECDQLEAALRRAEGKGEE